MLSMNKPITIAIDGYASSGKSTLAKDIATKLGYIFIDSGAMYRAVALFALENDLIDQGEPNIEELIEKLGQINLAYHRNPKENALTLTLNGEDVSQKIRSKTVSALVSSIALIAEVRTKLVEIQRTMGQNGGVVMDGRDIGTVVFPKAEVKIFVTADMEVRARRRQKELESKSSFIEFEEVKENLEHRDLVDTTRTNSPLKKAEGACVIDTTNHSRESQLEIALQFIQTKLAC